MFGAASKCSEVWPGSERTAGQDRRRATAARRSIAILLIGTALCLLGATEAAAREFSQTGTFGNFGSGKPSDGGNTRRPGGVAADQETGEVFVADTGNNRIDVFGSNGRFERAFGWGVIAPSQEEEEEGKKSKQEFQVCQNGERCTAGYAGEGEGEFSGIDGVAVSPLNGLVYTISHGDSRIQAFKPSGEFVFQFGGREAGNPEKFNSGTAEGNDIAIDAKGNVYVSEGFPEEGPARVLVFGPKGKYLRSITNESGIGRLFSASSVAIDSNGTLYVNDEYAYIDGEFSNRIIVFDAAGNYVRREAVGVGAHGLAVDPEDNHLFVQGSVVNSKGEDVYSLYEYDPAGNLVEQSRLPGLSQQKAEESELGRPSYGLAFGGAAELNGIEGGKSVEREKGALYATDVNANQGLILTSPKAGAPVVRSVGAGGLSTDAADLSALIDPHSAETTYYFEYGPTAAYGSKSPAGPASIGDGSSTVQVIAHLSGLQPGATYHYSLVVVNPLGTVQTSDRTFTTPIGPPTPTSLPDGRAYELVSPLDKGLNDVIESLGQSSSDGDAVAYGAVNGLPGSESGALFNTYVARRGESGWTTVPASIADTNNAGLLFGTPLIFSRDLNQEVARSNNVLPGTAPGGEGGNLFLRTNSPVSNQLLTPPQQEEGTRTISMVGASADFSRIFFQANSKLTQDAAENESVYPQLYEWSSAGLKLVSLDPQGVPIANGAEAVPIAGLPRTGAVSEDGSRIFFVSPKDTTSPEQLYVRVNGTETQELSKSVRSTPDPYERPEGVTFQGAASDGSSAFFTSNVELTDDADTGSNEIGPGEFETNDRAANLYRYFGGTLTDLSIDEEPGTSEGADVRGVLVAAGGNVAYFGATGVLAPGATRGASNLYRWSAGEGVRFVATLGEEDAFMQRGARLETEARTTADGSVLVFNSTAAPTGVSDANAAGEAVSEIYRYTPAAGVVCVSCVGSGTPSSGAALTLTTIVGAGPNVLSTDGSRIFFGTQDALVPGDTDGTADVYEWQGGAVRLISTGTGSSDAVLIDASPSGNDVFFTTRQRLVATDTDDNLDVYDARVGGGFPAPAASVPCTGESCLPPSASPPARPGLESKTFDGPGNKKHKSKKKKRKAKQCRVKAKKGKKRCTRHQNRHSTGKRG